jgi:hypothetical protein
MEERAVALQHADHGQKYRLLDIASECTTLALPRRYAGHEPEMKPSCSFKEMTVHSKDALIRPSVRSNVTKQMVWSKP